jgi:hypothetical protein
MEVGSNTEVDNAGFLCIGCAVGTLPPAPPAQLASFSLNPSPLTLIKGAGAGTVTASGFLDTNDQALSGVTVTWSKKNGVDPTGSALTPNGNTVAVTPGATAGEFTLLATAAGVPPVECTVIVKDPDDIAGPDASYKPSLQGITCFDVRPDKDIPDVEPREYTVVPGGTTTSPIVSVTWGVTTSNNANLLDSYAVDDTPNTTNTLYFKDLATLQSVANPTVQTIELVAIVTYEDGQERKVTKTVKIQYKACCDGAIIYGAAWNYSNGQPGDGAKVGGAAADNYTDQSWSPNIKTTGVWAAGEGILDGSFTAPSPSIDLCVYKSNGNSGNGTTWNNAVNKCASGEYADQDAAAGWYLPNQRELQSIYKAIGGNGSSKIDFSALSTTGLGTVATTAENMVSTHYWRRTEYDASFGLEFYFDMGMREARDKASGTGSSVRCVRRL